MTSTRKTTSKTQPVNLDNWYFTITNTHNRPAPTPEQPRDYCNIEINLLKLRPPGDYASRQNNAPAWTVDAGPIKLKWSYQYPVKYYNTEEDPDLRHHENENASYSYSLRLPDDVKTAPELAELAAVLNAINAEYHKAQPAPVLRSWEDPQPPASLGEYNHRTPAKWLDAIESAGINRAIRDPRDLEYRPYASRIHAEYKRFITEDAHFTVTVFTDTHERAQQESLRMWLKMAAQSYQPDQTMEKINAWTAQGKPVSEVTPSRYWHNEQPLDYRPAHKIVRILDMDELYTPPAPEPEDDQEQEQEQEDQPPSC